MYSATLNHAGTSDDVSTNSQVPVKLIAELASGRSTCRIMPELGGAILTLSINDVDILRPAAQNISDVRDAACFPLLPFANRIDRGKFEINGETISLLPDPVGSPHALHGHGWRGVWKLALIKGDQAIMRYDHVADDWPWSYRAEQRLWLDEKGLSVELLIHNTSRATMPVGAGLHPFFPAPDTAKLRACATAKWEADETGLATTRVDDDRFDWRHPVPIADLSGLDNYFEGVGPAFVIERDNGRVIFTASRSMGFHVYVPDASDFFCLEPTDHEPNHFAREMLPAFLLAPGNSRQWNFRVERLE